jgi:hypothetical protein
MTRLRSVLLSLAVTVLLVLGTAGAASAGLSFNGLD